MQYWVDSHCHLHYSGLVEDIDSVLTESEQNDVKCLVCVSTDMKDHEKIEGFIHSDLVYQSIGIHPLSAAKYTMQEIRDYLVNTKARKIVAIGETGLDDFREPLNPEQIDSFRIHIEHAILHDLPIIMHTRCGADSKVESMAQEIIASYPAVRGVAHCFGGTLEFANFLIERGWYISFAGNLTYKSAKSLQAVARALPIEKVLIETDAPFLSPEGHRGTENRPVRVLKVADKLAELKGLSLDEVKYHTYTNFKQLFRCGM